MSLYLVATPIGNLEDITMRAVKTLQEVEMVFAEDTRHTAGLLNHLEIKKPLQSYHEYSSPQKHQQLLDLLQSGTDVALCSDAGMPCINDPGQQLVADAIALGVTVIPIPGPNAALTALIASGLPTEQFAYLGFYPRKKDEKLLSMLETLPMTAIFYESPNRILATVAQLAQAFPNRKAVIARELTKLHEEFLRGTLQELHKRLEAQPIKGEIVLLLEPAEVSAKAYTDEELVQLLQQQIQAGSSKKDAVAAVTEQTGEKKNRVYKLSQL